MFEDLGDGVDVERLVEDADVFLLTPSFHLDRWRPYRMITHGIAPKVGLRLIALSGSIPPMMGMNKSMRTTEGGWSSSGASAPAGHSRRATRERPATLNELCEDR